jgi:putative ABC transport system permease protein
MSESRTFSHAAAALYRRCHHLVRVAGSVVPERRRGDWMREWEGELWYRVSLLDRASSVDHHAATRLTIRTFGAFPHALWVFTDEARIDPMLQDLKYALRGTIKHPMFSALVVLTLALGIGANSAMFSIVNSVLIKPLPYERPDELVYMYGAFKQSDAASVSPPDYLDYRERNRVFSSLAARTIFGTSVLSGGDEPERVRSSIASANLFSTLGIKPYRGRGFLPEEENGEHAVAILSYGLWQRRFAGDQRIIGQTINVDGKPLTVVGIMPPVLDRTLDIQLWQPIPFNTDGTSVRRFHYLRLVGRLRPGVTLAQAQRDMDDVARTLEAAYPENEGWHLRLVPYGEVVVGTAKPVLLVLLGAVGVVLLIACGNVASLLLARATARNGEMAVRVALGAGRGRLVRQLLTESVLLGVIAGILGLGLAYVLIAGIRAVGGGILPRLAEVEIDSLALAFTFVLSLVTSLAFGAAPALHAIRSDLAASMKSLGRASSTNASRIVRNGLVVAQVALSFVLLIGAGLLIRSLWELQRVETGFDPRGVIAAEVSLPTTKYETRADIIRFWTLFLDRVRAIPGVQAAGATTLFPLRGGGDTYFHIEGQPPATDADKMNATISSVTDDYFATMRIRLAAGRGFGAVDRADGLGVTVISEALARRLFPGQSALGRRLVVDFGKPFTAEIVGVVADVRVYGQSNDAPDLMYFSIRQPGAGFGGWTMNLAARVRGSPASITPQLRATIRAIEPDVPLSAIQPVTDILADSRSAPRFRTQLFAGFASVALLLAVVGLYGTLAYTVTQRLRELGIRIALGAQPLAVFKLVVGQGMLLVGLGVVLGVGASFAATRLLEAQLFQVTATDPIVFVGVSMALLVAGLAACMVPARRETRSDTIGVLRLE